MSEEIKRSTIEDDSPVFKTWSSWYWLILIFNVLLVSILYILLKFV